LVVDKSPEEYKAAQEAAEKVRQEALADEQPPPCTVLQKGGLNADQ
jgi:hypothetical protein